MTYKDGGFNESERKIYKLESENAQLKQRANRQTNVESAKAKIRGAMETLRQLSCEEPPDNGRTLKELENDEGGNKDSLDSVSHTGQWAYLLLRDALKELEGK
jgi:hypothetical protein